MTFFIFLILITIVSFLLIIAVMVQNPKGGGLSSAIGGSQVIGGVQKTSDFLDKATWTLATILVTLIILSSLSFGSAAGESLTDDTAAPTAAAPAPTAPAAGTTAPAGTATTPATPAAPAAQPK
ncbi:preprotein translocase subunit SecG [Flavobacterium sp. RHBU_24]|uniref:preprotein translocase subunit SecG n=1 Tax=Flavobacterium sp. RHBU_24 TaxID=3391185 RepID=UPI003984FDEB